jgi:hypothetical protein
MLWGTALADSLALHREAGQDGSLRAEGTLRMILSNSILQLEGNANFEAHS